MIRIQMTPDQIESLAPLLELVNEAAAQNKRGNIVATITDDLATAMFSFIDHETAVAVNDTLIRVNSEKQRRLYWEKNQ